MKSIRPFFALLLVFLFLGCDDDDNNITTTGDGLLIQLERALDGLFYEWTDLSYDQDQNLISIEIQLESFSQQTYEVTYAGGEPVSLSYTFTNTNSGNSTVTDYDIVQQGNEIVLSVGGEEAYRYGVSEGYIDYCKAFYGPNNEYFNETVFTRDADNNIQTVAYFATDASSTDLKVFEYTFSDHTSDFALPAVYNPVLDFSFTGFNAQLGELMGLKISNQPPLQSSYWDASGTFREENITTMPVVDDGVLQELSYADESTGNDNYLLRLSYN